MAIALFKAASNSRAGTLRISILALVAVGIISTVLTPYFLTSGNIANLATQATALCIAAMGQALVIVTGGLDISVGSVISLTTAIASLPINSAATIPLAFLCALAIGAANGIGIARFNVHPIIMTLSTMSIAQGLALLLRPIPGGAVPGWLVVAAQGAAGSVPYAVLWVVVAAAMGIGILHRSRLGLHLFAIGGNVENARLNGVKTERVIVTAYTACSLFACLAGLFLAGRLSSGDPTIGSVFSLDSVTAVALGGVSLAGGIGSGAGAIVGALLVGTLSNTMNLTNVSAFLQTVVKGVLLLAVVMLQRRKTIGL